MLLVGGSREELIVFKIGKQWGLGRRCQGDIWVEIVSHMSPSCLWVYSGFNCNDVLRYCSPLPVVQLGCLINYLLGCTLINTQLWPIRLP